MGDDGEEEVVSVSFVWDEDEDEDEDEEERGKRAGIVSCLAEEMGREERGSWGFGWGFRRWGFGWKMGGC